MRPIITPVPILLCLGYDSILRPFTSYATLIRVQSRLDFIRVSLTPIVTHICDRAKKSHLKVS